MLTYSFIESRLLNMKASFVVPWKLSEESEKFMSVLTVEAATSQSE